MVDKDLKTLEQEQGELLEQLSASDIDQKTRAEVSKKLSGLEKLIQVKKDLENTAKEKAEAEAMAKSADPDLKELCEQELDELIGREKALEKELQDILYPPDPRDSKPAFLEIRAGAGGQEASLFVGDLLKLYSNYALSKGWELSINSAGMTEVGGYREIIAYVKGKSAFRLLKYESGVHRVQRVPKTETAGRIHTSTVTVAVMPEADDVEVDINPADLRIDVFRASGAGGQHVNTTDSAVRITHAPTGVVVSCQQERSQQKNKAKALKELKTRILQAELEKNEKEQTEKRKQQIGSGDRSEKVRTYNYPQNRVTDHRIGLTLKKLDVVMQGNLDEIVEPLAEQDQKERVERAQKG